MLIATLVRDAKATLCFAILAWIPSWCLGQAAECAASGSLLAQCAASWDNVFRNGNRLVDPGQAFEAGYFEGYVMGVSDATLHRSWCPALPYTNDQIDAIVARHLRNHPEAWQQRPKDLVATALGAAYPCPISAR